MRWIDVQEIKEKDSLFLPYHLQFFAKEGAGGEKTEEPTTKKLSDASKEGQVAKSQDMGNALLLIALFLLLKLWAGTMGTQFLENFESIYSKIPDIVVYYNGELNTREIYLLINGLIGRLLMMLLPIFAIGVLVCVVVDLAQVKWSPTSKPLMPKFSKLNPITGFSKIISTRSLVEFVKSIGKILIVYYVVYNTLKDKLSFLYALYDIPLTQAVLKVGGLAIDLGLKISFIYLILALVDLKYQKWKFHKDMKMTKQEVKDEYKNAEGDPQIRAQIKQKMREASQRRMMQSLPQADVVITNPTHYAVAVKYDPEVADAPYVLAKGEDFLAQRIKETAKANNIEIVENKPLARMLYHNVDVGAVIPPELYHSVAEVLAFVYNLKNKV